jgi:hypothetical protein
MMRRLLSTLSLALLAMIAAATLSGCVVAPYDNDGWGHHHSHWEHRQGWDHDHDRDHDRGHW